MAWLTLEEALDALLQRLQTPDIFSPAQRVAIVDIVYRWRQELRTQQRAPGERRKCSVCGNTVAPAYVVDSEKLPAHIICLRCWDKEARKAALAKWDDDAHDWESLLNLAQHEVDELVLAPVADWPKRREH
jgi:hypothetical protein